MKKVLKSQDSKEEVQAPHTPKWNNEKSDMEQFVDNEAGQQAQAKVDMIKEKRKISTKSSPDSRQRSNERLCNSNPKGTAKTNTIKRGTQMASKGGKQLSELMKPKRKLIQKGQAHVSRNTKSQPNTRNLRNSTSQIERQTRLSATQNTQQDIDEKNKNKSLQSKSTIAAGPTVEFTLKRQPRSQSKRTSKLMNCNQQEQINVKNGNGLGYLRADEAEHDDDSSSDQQDNSGNNQYNGHDNLSNINCSTNFENNSKTKGDGNQRQVSLDGNNYQLAPTTAESKNIVQHHQQMNQLIGISSSEQQQTNLGLITPHIDSSNLKTINTTNNIQLLINQQNNQFNLQSFHTNQIHKDLALGISAAANSLLKDNNTKNHMKHHSYLKRPLDRSNQKSKHSETNNEYQRSRSRSNRQAVKASMQGDMSSEEKSADSNHGRQDENSSSLSDAEVTMSNLNEADQMVIGAKQVNDAGAAATVDILIEGQDMSSKYNANRKNSQALTQPTVATKRSKDIERTANLKSKRNNQVCHNEDMKGGSGIINPIDTGKKSRRILKQQNKEAKAAKDTDQQHNQVPGTGRQLRCHKQSGKKTTESKQQPVKQVPAKRRARGPTKNYRDKSKDRAGETNGCAVLDDQHRRHEMTVTIFKQADDFAHAQNGNKNLAGPIVLTKRQKKDVQRAVDDESEDKSQSNDSEGEEQSSDFEIEQAESNKVQDRVLQSQVPIIGQISNNHYNNAQKMTIQNQLEQLISFGIGNGCPENSNSITDSDKQNIEQEISKLDAQYQSRINQLPLTMGLSQLQGGNTQYNQLGLHAPQTQKDSANGMTANKLLANLSSFSQLANVAKIFNLNNKVSQTPGNIGASTQLNQNLQAKSQLGFKTPVPIIGMGQHQKINYDDSDFNNNTQFRKMPERSNSIQKKDGGKYQGNNNKSGGVKNDQANNNLLTLFNAREQDRQQQEAKKNKTLMQIAQQNQAAKAAGLDELDPFTQRYQILKEVGRGAFGSVFKALDRKQAQQNSSKSQQQCIDNFVAIKKLYYDRKYEQREVPMLVEIKSKRLNDNIIRLKDRYLKQYQEVNQKKPWQRITKEYLFIVTDYLPHTICDLNVNPSIYLSANGQETAIIPSSVSPQQMASAKVKCLESIRQVMHGVFRGLRDLHSIGITHRDIKLSNILLDNDRLPITKVKICDLGSSKKLMSNAKDQSTQSLNYIGTRSFRAPELLVGNRYYDTKIDIWSAGVVFLKLLLGFLNKKSNIFNVSDSKGLAKVIVDQIGDPTESELKEMLASNELMSNSVKQGLTDQDIMKKRFKKLDTQMKNQIPPDAMDLLHKILQLSPSRRISAADALLHPYFHHTDMERKESVQKLSMINRTTETTSPCTNPNTLFFGGHNSNNQPN